MAIQPGVILAHRFDTLYQSYTERDAILYALGLGLGADPIDAADLTYLIETELQVLPTMGVTLASPGMWIRDPKFGVDFAKLVHSAQATVFHRDLPPRGSVKATPDIVSLSDRGKGKGAVIEIERTVEDANTGVAYCTALQTLLLRGDGGFGGKPPLRDDRPPTFDRAPDRVVRFKTSPRAALIYRLSGDLNPLHADPDFASRAGFARPILHGLASYGIAAHVLARAARRKLASIQCRFSGVVFPGDELVFSIWNDGDQISFVAKVDGRTVLDRGRAIIGEFE
jgi:acyl dehydratase